VPRFQQPAGVVPRHQLDNDVPRAAPAPQPFLDLFHWIVGAVRLHQVRQVNLAAMTARLALHGVAMGLRYVSNGLIAGFPHRASVPHEASRRPSSSSDCQLLYDFKPRISLRIRSTSRGHAKPCHAMCKLPLPRSSDNRSLSKIRASAPSRAASPAKRRSRIFHDTTVIGFGELGGEGLAGV
jgi:hypothetical protein